MWNDASQVKSDFKKKDSSYFIFTFLAGDFFEFLYYFCFWLIWQLTMKPITKFFIFYPEENIIPHHALTKNEFFKSCVGLSVGFWGKSYPGIR